jgi:hypothetical protein
VLRQTTWPLILAGVDYEVALFREACDYPRISDEALHGTFDYVNDRQLYEQALPIARRLYGVKRQNALSQYRTLVERKLASDDMEEIIPAVHEGKVDSLFVDCDAKVCGRYDPGARSVEIIDEYEPTLDLIELAIEQTILYRGAVYPVTHDELPPRTTMCAIFRY